MDLPEENKSKKNRKRLVIITAAILLIAAVLFGIYQYNSIVAVSMRIFRMVGTVNLYEDGQEQAMKEKMRLRAGHSLKTADESLVMISLDETKLFTMEQSSRAKIVPARKKLRFELEEGSLFFNITEKIPDDEEFNITTSTMVCGIRGTSGYEGEDAGNHETLMVTDGLVHVVATNPRTLESTEVDVAAGEMITIYLDEEALGNATISIIKQPFREEDLPALALDAIAKQPELQKRIAKATGFSQKKLLELAKVCTVPGQSMYGQAINDLKRDGIRDSIPFMGNPAKGMVRAANNAVDIAGDNLPLEIAIITGTRSAADPVISSGPVNGDIASVIETSSASIVTAVAEARAGGVPEEKLPDVATAVSKTLSSAVSEMKVAKLSTPEIAQVVETIGTVFKGSIREAAGKPEVIAAIAEGKSEVVTEAVIGSISGSSEYVNETVKSEMKVAATGEETSVELLNTLTAAAKKQKTEEEASKEAAKEQENKAKAAKPAANTTAAASASQAGGGNPIVSAGAAAAAISAVPTANAAPVVASTGGSSESGNSSSGSSSGSGSSGGSGNSGSNPGGSGNNPGSAPAVYGNMTVAGGITGGTVTPALTANTPPVQGETVTLDIASNRGHRFQSLTVNTVDDSGNITGTVQTTEVTAGSQYTFQMPADKIVVNASFTPKTYNVNLNLGGATLPAGANNITSYTYGNAVALPVGVTKASDNFFDYSFTGWTDAPTGGNPVTGIGADDIDDKDFYPQFSQTARTYPISLSPNGGNALAGGNTVYYMAGTAFTLPAGPTKNDDDDYAYDFAGWYDAASGGNPVTGLTATDYGDKVFYAHWNQRSIRFSPLAVSGITGGSLSFSPTSYKAGQTVTVTVTPDTGKSLASISATDGAGTAVTLATVEAGKKYTFTAPGSAVSVSATFENATYPYTLYSDATTVYSTGTYTYGTGLALPASATKDADSTYRYSFDAWYDAATGGSVVTAIGASETGEKKYYAHWNTEKIVTGVSLPATPNEVEKGSSINITASIAPSDAAVQTVTFESSNQSVATVTWTGLTATVTGVGEGTSTITVKTTDGNKTASLLVTVKKTTFTPVLPTSISGGSISVSPTTYTVGDTVTITATPDTGKVLDTLTVKELNNNVPGSDVALVTVTAGTKYTFTAPEKPVDISATFKNATYNVTLQTHGGVINSGNVTSYVYGTGATLPTDVTRAQTATTVYEFKGWFTAETGGTGIVSIGATDTGDKTLHAQWTEKAREYDINIQPISNGSISVHLKNQTGAITKAATGATVVIDNITPATNYRVREVYAREAGQITNLAHTSSTTSIEFVMPSRDVNVWAWFDEDTYRVQVETMSCGAVTISSPSKGNSDYPLAGETVTVTILRPSGYHLGTFTVAGQPAVATLAADYSAYSYQFTMPSNSVYIFASMYSGSGWSNISTTTTTNGSVVQTPGQSAAYPDQTRELTVTPAEGYELDTLTVTKVVPSNVTDSSSSTTVPTTLKPGTDNIYTFTMPPMDVTVSSTFKKIDYTITNTAMTGGTINHAATAQMGDTVTLTVVPETGKSLQASAPTVTKLDSGGNSAGEITPTQDASDENKYTFTMPANNVTVGGTFVNRSYQITYETHGGTIATANYPTTYTYGTGLATLPVATKAGSAFAGWFDAQTGGNKIESISTTKTGPVTLHAQWTTAYTVSVDTTITNGTVTPDKTSAAENDTVTLTVAPATNYELDTLSYTPENGTATAITAVNGVYSFTMPAANVTVNATFKASSGSIFWSKSGGTVTFYNSSGAGRTAVEADATFDSGNPGDQPWSDATKIVFAEEIRPTCLEGWFANMDGLSDKTDFVDIGNLNTSSVTNMKGMFYGCNNLVSLDLSTFDTSSVTNMEEMFDYCVNLTELNLSGFDTSSVDNMGYMFTQCEKIEEIDVSSFDTSSARYIKYMFSDCDELTTIYASGDFDTTHLTSGGGEGVFRNSGNLRGGNGTTYSDSHTDQTYARIDAPGTPGYFTLRSASNSITISAGITNGTVTADKSTAAVGETVTLTITPSNGYILDTLTVTDSSTTDVTTTEVTAGKKYTFEMPAKSVTVTAGFRVAVTASIDITKWYSIVGGGQTWAQYSPLIDATSFARSSVQPDSSIMNDSHKVSANGSESIYIWKDGTRCLWYTSADVALLPSIFSNAFSYGENSLVSVDLTGFDASNTTSLVGLFSDCNCLTTINWGGIDTSNVNDMSSMFSDCSSLTSFSLGVLDTSSVTSFAGMFSGCTSLESFEIGGADTGSLEDMQNMFYGCSNLKNLDFTGIDTSKVWFMDYIFAGCKIIEVIDLSPFDWTAMMSFSGNNMSDAFYECNELKTVYVGSADVDLYDRGGNDGFFEGCSNIEGSNGTTSAMIFDNKITNYGNNYEEFYDSALHARVDTATYISNPDGTYTLQSGNPGYFTLK